EDRRDRHPSRRLRPADRHPNLRDIHEELRREVDRLTSLSTSLQSALIANIAASRGLGISTRDRQLADLEKRRAARAAREAAETP
ncbi:hypothetical protein, partial [Escherichia coli]|uniref:hypothetical protein n=1 Tax=Escherichia coli TaxID=562 RepID=UPI001BE3DFD2